NGVIFKLVPYYFQQQAGIVNGIVSMMGGLGGFFPPLVLAAIHSITGQYSIGFMLLSSVSLAGLVIVISMHYQGNLEVANEVFYSTGPGMLLTDSSGSISAIPPASTMLTGYTEAEAVGKAPAILNTGRQDRAFYDEMWHSIHETGM